MTELMKRYEADFEKGLTHACYESWLEAKVLDGKTIEKFQEIIRNQCDEISSMKAQLTWRPVTQKPEKAGKYFVEAKPYMGCESTVITTAYFDGESFLWHAVISWLPIPLIKEGE